MWSHQCKDWTSGSSTPRRSEIRLCKIFLGSSCQICAKDVSIRMAIKDTRLMSLIIWRRKKTVWICIYVSYCFQAMQSLYDLRQNNLLCDAVLRLEDGGVFPVHRAILSACSTYFRYTGTRKIQTQIQALHSLGRSLKCDAVCVQSSVYNEPSFERENWYPATRRNVRNYDAHSRIRLPTLTRNHQKQRLPGMSYIPSRVVSAWIFEDRYP